MDQIIKVPLVDDTELSCMATASVVYEFMLEKGEDLTEKESIHDFVKIVDRLGFIIWRSAKSVAIIRGEEPRFKDPKSMLEFISSKNVMIYGAKLLKQANQIEEPPLMEGEIKQKKSEVESLN